VTFLTRGPAQLPLGLVGYTCARYVLVKVPSITARVTQEQRKILFEEFKSRG